MLQRMALMAATNDTGSANPITLFGSKLEGWYAPTSSFTEVSGAVSQWSDLGPRGNHLAQSTALERPVRGTFAGRNAVIFDGTDDNLITNNLIPMKTAIIAVFGHPNNNSSPPFVWSGHEASLANRIHDLHLQSNGSIRAVQNDAGPYADTPTSTAQSFYDDCILAAGYGDVLDTAFRAHLNGRSVAMSVTPTGSTTILRCQRFGRRGDGNFPCQARFTEIIMISDWLVPDIEKAEGYLAWKYGGNPLSRLITTHPYKSAAPTV